MYLFCRGVQLILMGFGVDICPVLSGDFISVMDNGWKLITFDLETVADISADKSKSVSSVTLPSDTYQFFIIRAI